MSVEYKAGYMAWHRGEEVPPDASSDWRSGYEAASNGELLQTTDHVNDR